MSFRNVISACSVAVLIVASACSLADATDSGPGTSTPVGPTTPVGPALQVDSRGFIWSPATGTQEIPLPPGAEGMWVTGINERGEVVGYVTMRSGTEDFRAFIWSESGGYKSLGSLVGPQGISLALALNDSGTVIGLSDGPSSNLNTGMNIQLEDEFVWTASSGINPLGPVPGLTSRINDSGTMVGISQGGIFVWSANTGAKMLPLPEGTNCSAAFDLNDNGQVLGYAGTVTGGLCAFELAIVWDADGSRVPIEKCVAKYQAPCGIYVNAMNNRGEVAGSLDGVAFRWTQAAGFIRFADGGDTSGRDINDAGDIAGSSFDVRSQRSSPFLWMASGEVRTIPLPQGSTTAYPVAVNGLRQVVGNFR